MIIGRTKENRFLAIIVDQKPEVGVYYTVTALTADKKERMLYTMSIQEE
jgi:hypothetical protein